MEELEKLRNLHKRAGKTKDFKIQEFYRRGVWMVAESLKTQKQS